jgi:puromycin-sensitive aminopeptidase
MERMSKKVKRLFAGFAPKHYAIDIDPDRDSMRLRGSVTIAGKKSGRPSQRLTFHQQGLKITAASIIKKDKKGARDIPVARINHHKAFEEVRLHADEMLYPGKYEVRMEFSGEITRNMEGIYPCFFKHGGQDKRLIATQFESHHAREAFPCIDEPEAKATFDLTVASPKGETIIANTPVKEQKEANGKLVTTFETTPVMSTYLLAFVYGELAYKEAKTKRGVVVRTYATPDNVAHTDFALETAVKCLEFYEDYFDIAYPLAKCDFIALPDFASGAMENWGCITFREQALLVDPANTSLPGKQRVAEVICHELTHQWFGNLITMRWWTDLWLNEGFATWMAYLAMDHLFPEWEVWTDFITDGQQYALKLDALANTHAIEVPINHPDEIRTIFDAISYEKGASCIHMLAAFLGEVPFRDGLRHYLKTHAYGNTDTVNLWDALEKVSGKPVRDFMAAWIGQAGYPLVRAHIGDEVHLAQEQFLLNPISREERAQDKIGTLWPVPLTANAPLADLFEVEETTLPAPKQAQPLLLNKDHGSFYRTAYDSGHLARLASAVRGGALSPLDRLGLLSDTFDAAKAGYATTADALMLLEAYRGEDNHAVWDVIAGDVAAIRRLLNDKQLADFNPYVRALVAAQLRRLGWDAGKDESHFDTLLRPTILAMAAMADDPAVLKEAKQRFEQLQTEGAKSTAPDIRGVIYTATARHGDAQTFQHLQDMHNSSTSSEERLKLAAALTDFKQPELIKKALAAITTEAVRLQDAPYWIAYSFSNRYAHRLTWDWMIENWGWLDENLGNDLSFHRMPLYAARSVSDSNFLPHYQKFFETVKKPGLERTIKQGIEVIQWQSAWKDRDLGAIQDFLARKK